MASELGVQTIQHTNGTTAATVTSDGKLGVTTLAHTNGTTAATIDSSGRILQPAKPAFNVFYNGGSFEMAANTIFPLNTARVNVGSYFNLSTYKFTAPVSGTYFFSFRSMTNEQNTRIILYINGSSAEYLVYEDGGGTDWHPTHGDTIRTLSANDTVNIFNATSYTATMHGNEYNAFCGHLIG